MRFNKFWVGILTLLTATTVYASVRAYNASNVLLGNYTDLKCSTGVTCTISGNKLNIVSSPTLTGPLTLESAEVLSNTVDDIVDIASNDADMIFSVTSPLASNGDATLRLVADASADNGDDWQVQHDGGTNSLLFQNDTSGSQATKLTLATTGIMTLTGAPTLSDAEVLSNPSDDTVRIASNDASLVFDVYSPLTSDGDAILRLTADASADNGDDWQLKNTGAGNAFAIMNDTSGSQVAKLSLSTAGAMTSVVSITGAGTGSLSGYLRAQVASTTGSLTIAQCGSTIVSNSTDVQVLPEASTALGCRYTFVCGTADDFDIDPADGTDQIGVTNVVGGGAASVLGPSAGDEIRCTDIGSSITIEATAASYWTVIGPANGAWTDVD